MKFIDMESLLSIEIFHKIAIAFHQGGFWMWFIFVIQMVSFIVIFDRLWSLYLKRNLGQKQIALQFEKDIRAGNLDNVMKRAKKLGLENPINRAIVAGTNAAINFGGQQEIQGKMDEILLEEQATIEKRTGYLSMLGNVGTLAGLLGTIIGMIKAFSAVGTAQLEEKALLLSEGISEAMNTTAYGLIMAIPALIMFAILQNRTNSLSEDLHQGSLKIFNWLSYTYEAIPKSSSKVVYEQQTMEG